MITHLQAHPGEFSCIQQRQVAFLSKKTTTSSPCLVTVATLTFPAPVIIIQQQPQHEILHAIVFLAVSLAINFLKFSLSVKFIKPEPPGSSTSFSMIRS